MYGFHEIIHTADIGLEITADTIENLFIFALNGYYKLALSDNYSFCAGDDFVYSAEESDYENMLITFLSEVNYLLMVKSQIVKPLKFIKIGKKNKKYFYEVKGETKNLNNPAKDIETEIKAVTYHQIKIIEESGIFSTKVFFDI
ncbi:MAG: archease [Calditrichaceae bacterium]|nr:archease [Calditrichaceae bacterium]